MLESEEELLHLNNFCEDLWWSVEVLTLGATKKMFLKLPVFTTSERQNLVNSALYLQSTCSSITDN